MLRSQSLKFKNVIHFLMIVFVIETDVIKSSYSFKCFKKCGIFLRNLFYKESDFKIVLWP
jgi:hypothetical protein